MTEELEATIESRGAFRESVRVQIRADEQREEEFNQIREAVKEILHDD